jgi:intraflagellar transport protein 88
MYSSHADTDRQCDLILEAIRNDDLRRYEQTVRSEAESRALLAAKIIAPLIEPTFQAGFEWCIEQVGTSEHFEIFIALHTFLEVSGLRHN